VKTLPLDPGRQGEAGDDSSAFSSCLFATRVARPSNQKESLELQCTVTSQPRLRSDLILN
jgi:hypothetical protein